MVVMKNYTHLTQNEREVIFLQLGQGLSFRQIGVRLGRHYTTVAREMARNTLPPERDCEEAPRYSPAQASLLSVQRRQTSKRGRLEEEPDLQRFVIRCLARGWSPEQIAGRLKLKVPERAVSHETIYQFVYAKENRPLRLWEFLRRGRCHRQGLFSRKAQTAKRLQIPGKVPIEQRPLEADQRLKVGHFEADLMEGRRSSRAAVSVAVDRKALYVSLNWLEDKEADHRARVLAEALREIHIAVKTLTLDNGAENYEHHQVSQQLGCRIFFCNPYHSWEKGTVENTIGLVRSYLPRGTDLSQVKPADLKGIAWELNHRPRKKLGFYTPAEVVYNETGWCA